LSLPHAGGPRYFNCSKNGPPGSEVQWLKEKFAQNVWVKEISSYRLNQLQDLLILSARNALGQVGSAVGVLQQQGMVKKIDNK